jgi:hypothetical protein
MTYQLITARSAKDLAEKVNQMISEGWELQGRAGVGGDVLNLYFAQAMVKPPRQ